VDQLDLLRHVVRTLEGLGVPYMLVGSIASGAYGEPRFTQDIDVIVALRAEQVDALCDAFPAGDYYVSPHAAREAVRRSGQFNVIHAASGTKVDFILARTDAWGASQLVRRQKLPLFGQEEAYVGSPEDVIIGKMLYYRRGGSEKHLRDITGILKVSGDAVDRSYVARWADSLGLTEIWRAVLRRVGW